MRKQLVRTAVVLLALTACTRATGPVAGDQTAEPTATTTAPSSGGASMTTASCIERYSLQNLRHRQYAFDGTVTRIDAGQGPVAEGSPDRIVFRVTRWFKGGSGTTATRFAHNFRGYTSADGTPHAAGERLLVAGEEDSVWTCGFTQRYDERVAKEWEQAFSG